MKQLSKVLAVAIIVVAGLVLFSAKNLLKQTDVAGLRDTLLTRPTFTQADGRYPKIEDGVAAYVKECLYTKTTQISNTGNTTENTVLTFTLPAGKMGPNGYLNIFLNISHTSNTNYKSANIYINGTKVAMATSNGLAGAGSRHLFTIVNRNSVSSQVFTNPGYVGSGYYSGNLGSSSTPSTASINTNAEMTVTVTLQCATSASDTVNLEFLLVESVYQP